MAKNIDSLIGQALTPDFSEEKDLGDALYSHMQYLSPLLRNLLASGSDADPDDINNLLQLFNDGFCNGLEEFDVERTKRTKAA